MVERSSSLGTVAELVGSLPERPLPLVGEGAGLGAIIDAFAACSHSRLLYVVDAKQRLLGVLALGDLLRYLFFHYQGAYIDPGSLVGMATSENARDLMRREPVTARPEEELEPVIERMTRQNVKELPVTDGEGRVIADLTMVDILVHYKEVKGPDLRFC